MLSKGFKDVLPYTRFDTYEKLSAIYNYLREFKSDEEFPFPYYYSEFIDGEVHYCTLRDMLTMDKTNLKQLVFFSTSSKYTGSRRRYVGKFGKWFKTVADWCKIDLNPQQLNEIVVAFNAAYSPLTFEIVEGEALRHWYLEDNTILQGSLGNSCMRHSYCQKYLNIYVDHCKMMIAKQGYDTKIVGRVLIWQDKFYDRIYSIAPNVEIAMQNYLHENKFEVIHDHHVKMPLKLSDYDYYPYMDNMNNYNEYTGILSNWNEDVTHEFCNTDGDYFCIEDEEDCDDDEDDENFDNDED